MSKTYQVKSVDEILAQATATLIEGRPDCTIDVADNLSLKQAIETAHAAGGRAAVMDGEHVVLIARDVPLASACLPEFEADSYPVPKIYPVADDSLTVDRLNKRMDAYYHGSGRAVK